MNDKPSKGKKPHFLRTFGAFLAIALVMAAAVLFYLWESGRLAPPPAPSPPTPGPSGTGLLMREDVMPDIGSFYRAWEGSLRDEQGNEVRLSDYRGAPLALLYWASWCPDCHEMMGEAQAIARAVEEAGGRFELVARTGIQEETAQTAAAYLSQNGIGLRTLVDEDAQLYNAIGLHWVPSLLFFDEEGTLMRAQTGDFSAQSAYAGVEYASQGGLPATAEFVKRQLMGTDGRVASEFRSSGGTTVTLGEDVLAETQGMAMLYAVRAGDRGLFNSLYSYVQTYSPSGLTPWLIQGGVPADVNATLDDLRILEALMEAQERWGGYEGELGHRARALYQGTAKEGSMVDFCVVPSGQTDCPTLTLCYIDLSTMRRLAAWDDRWEQAASNAQAILLGGILPDFPLYEARYNYTDAGYTGENLKMSEAMVAVYHAARAGVLPAETQAHLAGWLEQGPMYAVYTPQGSVAAGYGYESTATYAALVMAAVELQDAALARCALYRMERARIFSSQGSLNGAYVGGANADNYAFDTVYALLAWQALEEAGFAWE